MPLTHRRFLKALTITLGASALAVLVGPFLIPVPPLKNTHAPQDFADPDSQFIEINGLPVHIKTAGDGDTVFVLLHGFASSLYTWHAVMQPLSHIGKVIAYDRTGFGLSAHPISWNGPNPYTPQAQLDQLLGILDHFGIEQAILVGNSAGGTLACRMALAYPERVEALVLADPAIYIGNSTPSWLHFFLDTPQMRHLGPLIARQLVKRGTDLINLSWHDPSLIQPEMLSQYIKPFQVENWDRALWEITSASRPTGLVERLSEIRIPTLVITGDHDRVVLTRDSIRLANELPTAQLVVIADSGHIPQEEKPDAFMQAVKGFLQKN